MITVSAFCRPRLAVPTILTLAVSVLSVIAIALLATAWVQASNPVLILLMIAFAVPCLIAVSSYRRGFYVYLFILPFSYFLKRLLFLFPKVTQIEWFIATALTDMVLVFALCSLIMHKGLRIPKSTALLPVSLFLLWCILEIFNPNSSIIIGTSGFKKTAFYITMYYLALVVALRDNKVIDKVAKVTTLCAIIVAGYGFIQFCFGLAPFEMAQINSSLTNLTSESIDVLYSQGILRPFSTFSGPWVFGDFLVIGFMFNLFTYLKGKVGVLRFFLVSLWLAFGILISLSRSSYLMLVLALALLYVLQAKSKRMLTRRLVLTSIAVGLFIIAILLFWKSAPPGIATAMFAQHNLFGRIEQWRSLLSNPTTFSLFGLGIGSEQAAFYFGENMVVHTHSFLFTLLLELGVIGVGLFLMIFFVLARRAYRRMVQLPISAGRLNLVILLSILMSMFIARTAAGGLWGLHIHDNYFWLLCGLLAGSLKTVS